MFVFNHKPFEIITSKFTRQHGYSDIASSKKYSHKDAIKILNSFTPQGSSPQVSTRIGMFKDKLGAGYYLMLDQKSAKLATILFNYDKSKFKIFNLPLDESSTKKIILGDYESILKNKPIYHDYYITKFTEKQFSSILFSLLVGDNIIIVHPKYEKRNQFISILLNFLPGILFNYNRITTGCSELNGNENIIGIAELPKKYRSHKKLYLPLDTIFIDLEEGTVEGEGLKNCSLTRSIFENYLTDKQKGINRIVDLMTNVTNPNFVETTKYDEPSKNLIRKIQEKLEIKENKSDNWLLSF